MSEFSKQALKVENNTNFPNNSTGYITPVLLREFNTDMIDSTVNQTVYTEDSQSWESSIEALNNFTASASGLDTGSLMVTASAASNVITFTKGNGSTFNVTVADTTDLAPLNAFTASAAVSINALNVFTSSNGISALNAYTSSNDTKWNNLGAQSGSWITESETGSFAKLDGGNTFNGNQIISGNVTTTGGFYGNGAGITGITASVSLPILDEGIPQGNAFSMNFTGSGISATVVGGTAVVSVNVPDASVLNALTASFNTYTGSNDAKVNSLIAATASYANSASVAAVDSAQQAQINSLTAATASVNNSITSLNASSASQQISINALNVFTASQSTASIDNSITNLNAFTASQTSINSGYNSYTSSNDTKWSNLGGQSGSWVTESETASFARTDVSNTFTQAQTINADLNVSGTINAYKLNVTIESSSVIFSSGSNILGDELTDTQTLSGSVRVQGSLTVNGTPVQTSSVDISALNAFTQSAQISIDNLNSTTASLNTSVSNINAFTQSAQSQLTSLTNATSSYANSASVAAVDAGQQSQIDNLIAWTSSVVPTNISALNAFTASQDLLNDTFATTGSNTFQGNQIINGALTASLTEGYVWAGGAGNVSTLVATSSFGGGSTINTGSFATTGSNVFDGTQVVSGSINVSGSVNLFGEGANGFAFSGKALFLTNSVQTGITIESPIHFYQASKGDMYIQNNVAGVGSGSLNVVVSNNTFKIAADSGVNLNKTDGAGSVAAGGNVNFNVHSGSLFLTSNGYNVNTASMLHVSSSSNTNNVNLIFKNNNNTADTILSGSNNIFSNPAAPAAGFKRYMGNHNIFLASGSIPQISGSMAFSPTLNGNLGTHNSAAMFTFRGPVSSSTWTVSNNMLMAGVISIGPSATNHAQGIVAGLTVQGNVGNGNVYVIANKSNLTENLSIQANNIGGTVTLTAASSSIYLQGNTIQGLVNINNLASGSGDAVTNLSNGVYNWQNAIIGGLTVTATGSSDPGDISGNDYIRAMERNVIVGTSNLVQLDGQFTGSNALTATAILGGNLTVTGSNASANTLSTITNHGSAFVGRYNAQDGNRAKSAQTVFAVGTGTSSERKTGFLIDSGSNTFVEGTLNVSGSTTIQTLTASLAEGYVWVGNGSGITTTVATSSFGGGGGAAFPYTGDAQISGSLGVTGSVSGFVNSLVITSQTASMNFNDGNFFTLQLVSGSTTHLTASNIKPGQAINLLVKTDSGSAAASGSLTFSSDFKFAGGFDYTPTAVTASQDLVSFVTFDTTQIFAAQIKNLS